MSSWMLRLPRLTLLKTAAALCTGSPQNGPKRRDSGQPGGSMKVTSAPSAASIIPHHGPATTCPRSRMRTPTSGSGAAASGVAALPGTATGSGGARRGAATAMRSRRVPSSSTGSAGDPSARTAPVACTCAEASVSARLNAQQVGSSVACADTISACPSWLRAHASSGGFSFGQAAPRDSEVAKSGSSAQAGAPISSFSRAQCGSVKATITAVVSAVSR